MSVSDWTSIDREVFLDYDLEGNPIQIRTASVEGSDDELQISLYDVEEEVISSITLKFHTSPPVFSISHCTTAWTNFQVDVPADQDKVWTITKTETALKIECNNVELLNLVYSEAADARCVNTMGQDVEKIKFASSDTLSEDFRTKPPQESDRVYSLNFQIILLHYIIKHLYFSRSKYNIFLEQINDTHNQFRTTPVSLLTRAVPTTYAAIAVQLLSVE